jgi:hypothetical protein
MIAVYGKLPNEGEVLLATVERAGDAQAVKKEYLSVFEKDGITFRVQSASK